MRCARLETCHECRERPFCCCAIWKFKRVCRRGTPKKVCQKTIARVLVGGVEPIACEMVCAGLVNTNPSELPIVRTAKRLGVGCSDPEEIKIVGDDFSESICKDFKIPEQTPVRFSLLYVCRSICKQVSILTKNSLKNCSEKLKNSPMRK